MATEKKLNNYSYLEELSESDYEIVDGQPNIQGWDVLDDHGRKIGEVDDMLFNAQARKVRYIVLDMDSNDVGLEDGHVLIPIGVAELHENNDTVIVPGVTVDDIKRLPIYEYGREITPEIEADIRKVFVRPIGDGNGNVLPEPDFYDHEHFNETKFYGKRRPTSYLDEPNDGSENRQE